MDCKLCGKELTKNHLRIHKISTRDYYNQYVGPKNSGYCKCGKQTIFRGLERGYNNHCIICSNNIIGNNKKEQYKKYKSINICKICNCKFFVDTRHPRDICRSPKCRKYFLTDAKNIFDIKFTQRELCPYCGKNIDINNDSIFVSHLTKHFLPSDIITVYEYIWRNVWKLPIPLCKNCGKECKRLNGRVFANFCKMCSDTLNLNGAASRKYFYNKTELKKLYKKAGKSVCNTYKKKIKNPLELKKLRQIWNSNGEKISSKLKAYFKTDVGIIQKQKNAIKQSKTMRKMIVDGRFTPNITNSWTHWNAAINIDGNIKRFRSSWEACFYLSNPYLEYETIRVPYVNENNKCKITIVDFYDRKKRILYEIKPRITFIKQQEKINAIIDYCINNNIKFIWINEKNILEYVDKRCFIGDNLVQYEKMYNGIKK